ncbi:3578_t:CDS:2, partial [Dentiscutata erythropus]
MLEQVKAGNFVQDLKMDVLQAIFANISEDFYEASDLRLEGLIRSLNTLCLSNTMKTDKFLNFNGEDIVYKVSLKDQIFKELAYVFRNDESVEVIDEENSEVMDKEDDDSVKPAVVSNSSALNSLENVRMFLLQQEGSSDQLIFLRNLLEELCQIKQKQYKVIKKRKTNHDEFAKRISFKDIKFHNILKLVKDNEITSNIHLDYTNAGSSSVANMDELSNSLANMSFEFETNNDNSNSFELDPADNLLERLEN